MPTKNSPNWRNAVTLRSMEYEQRVYVPYLSPNLSR